MSRTLTFLAGLLLVVGHAARALLATTALLAALAFLAPTALALRAHLHALQPPLLFQPLRPERDSVNTDGCARMEKHDQT
eukprot:1161515-Pelagomonas_calceolata.AAC.7